MADVRDALPDDLDWILGRSEPIGGPRMVSQGFLHDLADYPALVAEENGERTGFVVYKPGNLRWIILAVRSIQERRGLGSQLLDALETRARNEGAESVRISTTNDNMPALRFLQLRGYRMRQMLPGAFENAKKLKGLPLDKPIIGRHGIEIRDEIVLNKAL